MGRILIWDENHDLRLALAVLLEDAGHVIDEVSSSADFLRVIQEHRPGLILIDLNEPGEDGLTQLRWIKGTPELRALPVVVISSWSSHEEVTLARSLGAFAYIAKPWRAGEVELAADLALASREALPVYGRDRANQRVPQMLPFLAAR